MDIDLILPEYDFVEHHERFVAVPPETAYQAFKHTDFSKSVIISMLFRIRGLESEKLPSFIEKMFVLFSDRPPLEIVWGFIGRPWTAKGDRQTVDASQFTCFNQEGFAKIAWNFTFTAVDGGTLIGTQTRVKCTDKSSRRKFRIYWFFVRPFSGLIRRLMLRLIEEQALS